MRRLVTSWKAVAVAGTLVTLLITLAAALSAEARRRERIDRVADEAAMIVDNRLETYTALLRGGAGLFAAAGVARPKDFADYVERLELSGHYAGIQGIGYAVWLGGADREQALAAAHEALPRGVNIWPGPESRALSTIADLLPGDRRNQVALGYDMYSEAHRRAAMDRARDTGMPAASAAVELVQEIEPRKQPGFLIYAPIYAKGPKPTTTTERRLALRGWVYMPFRADDLFDGAFTRAGLLPEVRVQVFDGGPGGAPLYDSDPLEQARFVYSTDRRYLAAGRPWVVRVSAPFRKPDGALFLPAAIALGAGAALTAALSWAVRLQALNLSQARAAADDARAAGAQTALLLQEMNHRVANSLQLVGSLVKLQSDAVSEPAAHAALLDTRARILAVGRVHQRLYRSGAVGHVELAGYLKTLLDELGPTLEGGVSRLEVDAPDTVEVTPDKAVAAGVAVVELVTNAAKYAYAEGPPGPIRVALRRRDDRAELSVADEGPGLDPDAQPRGTGLGMKVVDAMAATLGAEVTIDPHPPGLEVRMSFAPG